MKHYASSIRRSGAPIEYSSNMYEHLHMAMIKTGYRMSNKRNFLDHIVKCNRRLEALRSNALEIDGYSCFFWEECNIGEGMFKEIYLTTTCSLCLFLFLECSMYNYNYCSNYLFIAWADIGDRTAYHGWVPNAFEHESSASL